MLPREATIIKRYFQCQIPAAIADPHSTTLECGPWTAYLSAVSDTLYVGVVNRNTGDEVYGPVLHTEYREWDIDALAKEAKKRCEACIKDEPNPACLDTSFCVECYPFVISYQGVCEYCQRTLRGVWIKTACGHVYHRKCYHRMEDPPEGDYAIL